MHVTRLLKEAHGESEYETDTVLKPLEEVVEHYGLEAIFGCPSLRYILIDGIDDCSCAARCSEDPMVGMRALGKWFKDSFLKLGRDVVMEITYRCGRFPYSPDPEDTTRY
jgi:hypothetical protein